MMPYRKHNGLKTRLLSQTNEDFDREIVNEVSNYDKY